MAVRVPPLKNLVPMLVAGLFFQACASGHFSYAFAAWFSLVSLATLARASSLHGLAAAFAVIWLGRLIGWHGVLAEEGVVVDGAGVVQASALAAALITACLACHRFCMRELPTLGPLVLPSAVVVMEWCAGHFGLPGASLLPLSTTQPGDTPLWRFVDVLTPLGVSFCVAWAQAVLAGFGEAFLADDPYPQKVRERGMRIASNLVFWPVVIGLHGGGWLRSPDATPGSHGDVVFAACAAYLVFALAFAAFVRVTRKP